MFNGSSSCSTMSQIVPLVPFVMSRSVSMFMITMTLPPTATFHDVVEFASFPSHLLVILPSTRHCETLFHRQLPRPDGVFTRDLVHLCACPVCVAVERRRVPLPPNRMARRHQDRIRPFSCGHVPSLPIAQHKSPQHLHVIRTRRPDPQPPQERFPALIRHPGLLLQHHHRLEHIVQLAAQDCTLANLAIRGHGFHNAQFARATGGS
ncbi:unnamed protein product [Peniophora sp. CBMAI 1063]|nr:unnamed protein product [Peniophora sp. CBMAI 1063]